MTRLNVVRAQNKSLGLLLATLCTFLSMKIFFVLLLFAAIKMTGNLTRVQSSVLECYFTVMENKTSKMPFRWTTFEVYCGFIN